MLCGRCQNVINEAVKDEYKEPMQMPFHSPLFRNSTFLTMRRNINKVKKTIKRLRNKSSNATPIQSKAPSPAPPGTTQVSVNQGATASIGTSFVTRVSLVEGHTTASDIVY